MINCPNPSCKTANPDDAQVCQVCQSAIPHYYLWGVGDLVSTLKVNSLVNQRYLLKRDHTFLDVKPGLVPESPAELPAFLTAYLHLSAYPLHVPRVYSAMKTPDGDYVMMLESSALATVSDAAANSKNLADLTPELLPELASCWVDAPPLRQLSWLWQIAQLWDAFSQEQVAATLLDDSLLRVDGSIVRLLALAVGQPTLMDLGRQWQMFADKANQAVRPFLGRLCEQLERQQLSAEQLSERLSAAIAICAQDQQVAYDLAVYTDQGPTRKRNEDACYPESGVAATANAQQTQTHPQLLIVCDGIGGHQGGDVASKLAIETIRAQLSPLLSQELSADAPELSSTAIALEIEAAICAANDEISAQNDRARRQARDRMGTTLVLALIKGADVYIAHLGDSRAYRASRQNCQQVTLDDDVASRQVRLAGGLYREALTQPGSGSLIQALGMGPSQTLRPTVQRFAIDDDCVFLLCSDGLSDSDLVEQFWPSTLSPLVMESGSVADAGQRLVDIANKYNGHDNVTVGLISAKVLQQSERIVPREVATEAVSTGAAGSGAASTTSLPTGKKTRGRSQTGLSPIETADTRIANATADSASPSSLPGRQLLPTENDQSRAVSTPIKVGIYLLLLAALGGLLYFLLPGFSDRFSAPVASSTGGLDSIDGRSKTEPTVAAAPVEPVDLSVGSYLRIRQASASQRPSGQLESSQPGSGQPDISSAAPGISDSALPKPGQILVYPTPEDRSLPDPMPGTMPVGAIAQVVALQTQAETSEANQQWVQLQLCTIPSGNSLSEVPVEGAAPRQSAEPTQPLTQSGARLIPPGTKGWALATSLKQFASGVSTLSPDQLGSCGG